jgi:flagellar L-ring protein precursor FlgH
MTMTARTLLGTSLALTAILGLNACGTTGDVLNITKPPALTPLAVAPNGEAARAISTPVLAPATLPGQPNALWRAGSRTFFHDPRASKVGDILTVNIAIGDQAKIANTTTETRNASENAGLGSFLGYESKLKGVLPDAVDPSKLVAGTSDSANTGTGSVDRSETINLTVAAVVTQVLPNGNLVIQGEQEVRVNFEVRELTISGIVRPEDISNANTISHTQIAEARISYGGRGQITNVQQPRYGQQFWDMVFPF